jgi:hypothetical protein
LIRSPPVIICHNSKFVYYGPTKTGTTSLGNLLIQSKLIDSQDGKHELTPRPSDACLADYFLFITVRNPFDRLVSMYQYVKTRVTWKSKKHEALHKDAKTMSFEEFVDKFITHGEELLYFYPEEGGEDDYAAQITYSSLLVPQANYLRAMPRQDLVIRMESFAADVRKLPFELKGEVPHVNGTIHKPWQAYYEKDGVAEEVVKYYADDFELLGYPAEVK